MSFNSKTYKQALADNADFDAGNFPSTDVAILPGVDADLAAGIFDGVDTDAPFLVSDAELSAIESMGDTPPATEAPVRDPAADETLDAFLPETPPVTEAKSFADVTAQFSPENVADMQTKTAAAFDGRSDFERSKDAGNENIQKTLGGARAKMITGAVALVMLATNVDPKFLTRSAHSGSAYNVYAAQKVADLLVGISEGGSMQNKINLAAMRTLFAFRKTGDVFTGEIAKCCASDKWKHKTKITAAIFSHTVSASTASTQASSTMQAFVTCGIVKAEGRARNPVYSLTDHPAVAEIEKRLGIAA